MKIPAAAQSPAEPALPSRLADDPNRTLRRLIWLYFWLLIFEGSLRKWVLPGLATPLLIIRDPVVVAIYIVAFGRGLFPTNGFIITTLVLASLNMLVSLFVNPTHPFVTFYGLRSNFLHLPLIYVIPNVLTYKDLRRFGFWTLAVAVPMAILVYRQFESPAGSWLNRGAGEGAGQLQAAFGRVRPAGTFSYSTGLVAYASVVGSFLFYQFFKGRVFPMWLVLTSLPTLFIMVLLSGSRSNLAAATIVVAGGVVISLYKPALLKGSAGILIVMGVVYLIVGSFAVIREGEEVIGTRIEKSGGIKVGMVDRFLDSLFPFYVLKEAPMLGVGVGMGTNAAAGMLFGQRAFLLSEGEWDRIILEVGPIMGIAYIFMRVGMALQLVARGFAALNTGRTLPLLLLLSSFLSLTSGPFGQPTMLGFAVLVSGFSLAAATAKDEGEEPAEELAPALSDVVKPVAVAPRLARGRSLYSERLHG